MTPVILLTDGYIANAAEPWRVPDMSGYAPFPVSFFESAPAEGEGVLPYARNAELARPWIKPGTPGPRASHRRHREGAGTGNIDYRPEVHQEMSDTRAAKVLGVVNSIPDQEVCIGPRGGGAGGGRLGLDLRSDPPGGAPRDRGRQGTSPTSTSATSGRRRRTSDRCSRGSRRSSCPR
jgi:hypothetical protein